MLLWGIYIGGKAWQTEVRAHDTRTLQDYMRQVEQQSHGLKTHTYTAAIHLTTFKNFASLL